MLKNLVFIFTMILVGAHAFAESDWPLSVQQEKDRLLTEDVYLSYYSCSNSNYVVHLNVRSKVTSEDADTEERSEVSISQLAKTFTVSSEGAILNIPCASTSIASNVPKPVSDRAEKIKQTYSRVSILKVKTDPSEPSCTPPGSFYYRLDVEVCSDLASTPGVCRWESIKFISMDSNGEIIPVCTE